MTPTTPTNADDSPRVVLDAVVRCYICGSTHDVRMSPEWLTGLGKPWCFECFVAWYDYGKTDLEEVRAKSLELQAANAADQRPAAKT
jgi:hypothetical protein